MADENTQIMSESEDQTEPKNFLSLFTNIKLNFSPFNREKVKAKVVIDEPSETEPIPVDYKEESEENKANKKQEVVKFSDPKPIVPPPLKLEVEDPYDNPTARWLVYALGGFLVLRWVWARWKERKERAAKKESSDDNENQAEDDDYHST